ncbi:RagB/SusD family nutrient uptake outer membrane protein [Mucilaginibacter aquaedulcis]|uniref:RagB/SusD family nutrient uptake outer membrane protein n=1 Tax=Mucilaginibacter aquaedulcis TaxID=1187081 RepID=UPI0025B5D175|nr:RagB/SusD family nutrient uptake outer membrane protein [Mucilaginibacter aquaedulcis]MDN3548832.1 RagB/SusD family nutrient uptake outer membrane protein [Mucilaginibacter aquaedulcis]
MMTNSGAFTFSNGGTDLYAGLSADELSSVDKLSKPYNYQFETNTIQFDNPNPYIIFWKPAYHTLNSVNNILEGVAGSTSPQLTDSARRELNGECKFVRAFHYFYLTNFFGDVPLALSADFNQTAQLPRAAQANVYTQIVADLQDAQSLLPGDYSAVVNKERIRPNKWAATALLSRVYLYQQRWKDAESQASLVIANTQYSLTAPAGTFLKNSSEAIWQLQPNTSIPPYSQYAPIYLTAKAIWANLTPAVQAATLTLPSIFSTIYLPTYYLSPQLSGAFEPNDLRKKTWTSAVTTPASLAPFNGSVVNQFIKYGPNSTVINNVPACYYMVLRLAEQYLIRAEARAQQNDLAGAASDLNVIRNRAGLPNTMAASQADLLAAVAQERRVELFAEWGHRFLDLKRTGKAAGVLGAITSKQPFNSNQLTYPIPILDLQNNPNLAQNPGY